MLKQMFFILCVAAAVAAAATPQSALQEEGRALAGYEKNFFMVFVPKPVDGGGAGTPRGVASNRVRVKLARDLGEVLSLQLAYAFSPRVQDPSLISDASVFSVTGSLPVQPYRVADLPATLYGPRNNFVLYQNLDRAYVKLSGERADLYMGRQVVAWGSAKAVNPTDIVAPFRLDELDAEERVGVDAVRLRYATDELSELDAGIVFGTDFAVDKSAFFIRDKLYLYNTDISLLLLDFRKNLLAGIDLAGAIGGAGVWCESAYVFAGIFDSYARDRSYFRASIGADYTFSDKAYGYLEYHYNGAGTLDSSGYLTSISVPAYSDGAVYLLGAHYAIPGITYQLTPLIGLAGQSLFNLADGSLYLNAQLEYNLYQNVYISIGTILGIGTHPVITASAVPQLSSEFGAYPDVYFSSLRVYF